MHVGIHGQESRGIDDPYQFGVQLGLPAGRQGEAGAADRYAQHKGTPEDAERRRKFVPEGVEGLVHINTLRDDQYQYEEKGHRLVGKRGKKSYRMGDPVTVQVARVDLARRNMDLELV